MSSGGTSPAGGGASSLAAVLAVGADAGGIGITTLGATTASTASGTTLTATSTSANGTGSPLRLIGADGLVVLRVGSLGTTLGKISSGTSWKLNAAAEGADNFDVLDISEAHLNVNLSDANFTTFAVRSGGVGSRNLIRCGFNDPKEVQVGYSAALLGFYGGAGIARPNVPLVVPVVQDVIDALVALGLVTQS